MTFDLDGPKLIHAYFFALLKHTDIYILYGPIEFLEFPGIACGFTVFIIVNH